MPRSTSRYLVWMGGALLLVLPRLVVAGEPPITALAFSPNGKSVVAGSQSGLRIYEWPTLKLRKPIEVGIENIHDLAFSPDGKRLAVGGGIPGAKGIVQVLSWPDAKSVRVYAEHRDSVMTLAWADNATLASGSSDRSVRIWNTKRKTSIGKMEGHSRGVTALCFLGDGETLVTAGIDRSIRVRNAKTGKLLRSSDIHTLPVSDLALRPSKEGLPMVASASEDKSVRLWQPTIGRMVRFARLQSQPLAVAWLPDGAKVIAACRDGKIRVIDPVEVSVDKTILALHGWVYSLAIHPSDGSVVVGGQGTKPIRISLTR